MTRKEKRLKKLRERLSLYEAKLFRHLGNFQEDTTESVSSKIKNQEVIMLNVAIDDLKEEIEELE